jgi:serine phosphatase RsbU (regulator of sigma subunit)
VTDALAPNETILGVGRAMQVLRDNRSRTATQLVDALQTAVRSFGGGKSFQDDVTAVVIKVA